MKTKILIFKITLEGVAPAIWRRIAVPATYTFWDLHVAIQDAIGWQDCHLHAFSIKTPDKRMVQIGIPDEERMGRDSMLPGWKIKIADFFKKKGDIAEYEYDFGDGWEHLVELESITEKEKGRKYPACLDGARACPPEDCGGPEGYERLLKILRNPKSSEYKEMKEWAGDFHPEAFDSGNVVFDNPGQRLKNG